MERFPQEPLYQCSHWRASAYVGGPNLLTWEDIYQLADKLAREGGICAPLSVDEERLLQAFHLVQQSHEGYRYEGAFDQLCQQVGLLHSDVGLLGGRVETLFAEREPALYEAEAYSIIHQWLRNKEGEK